MSLYNLNTISQPEKMSDNSYSSSISRPPSSFPNWHFKFFYFFINQYLIKILKTLPSTYKHTETVKIFCIEVLKNQFNCFLGSSIFWICVLISCIVSFNLFLQFPNIWKLEIRLKSLIRLRLNVFSDCVLSEGTHYLHNLECTINHIIRTDHLICYILVHFPLCISRDSFKQIFAHLFIIEIQFKFLPWD